MNTDQKCSRCGGLLEKERNRRVPKGWICAACKRKAAKRGKANVKTI